MLKKRVLPVAVLLVVVAAGCGWPYPGFDPAHTKYNNVESTVSRSNVAGLAERWRTSAPPSTSTSVLSVKGRVYADTSVSDIEDQLVAYDAGGNQRCSGVPRKCAPLLTFSAPPCAGCLGGFAVAEDTVYRWKGDNRSPPGPSSIVAYDATGRDGCNAQSRVCQPIRRYSTGAQGQSISMGTPIVVDGVLYVQSIRASGTRLLAFDARGTRSCRGTPAVCTPLWTGLLSDALSGTVPAVANGMVYVATDRSLAVFDAAGHSNCAGTPTVVCRPLWVGSGSAGSLSDPAVTTSRVYVSDGGTLLVYDARGRTGCSTGVCQPVWRGTSNGFAFGSPLVTRDRVFVPQNGSVSVYARNGCGGAAVCAPSSAIPFGGSVTGANGLVVVSGDGAGFVRIFDAAAPEGPALWTSTAPSSAASCSEALIADGMLISCGREPSGNISLRVHALPATAS